MTDKRLLDMYSDLLDEGDDPALFAVVRHVARAYPQVQPPAGLMDSIRAGTATAPITPEVPAWRRIASSFRPFQHVHRSVAVAVAVALAITLLGGAGYAMHLFGGPSRAHVVLSCSGFGVRWQLTGSGARMMSPQQFITTGGTITPQWRHLVSDLQRPQFWTVPANTDVVGTCGGSSSNQVEIGTNGRTHMQLLAISVVPLWQSNRPTFVGSLRLPPWGGCAPKPTTSPIRAPDAQLVAQFARVPSSLSRGVRVTFTPCNVPARTPTGLPPESRRIAFRILSQVQYTGSAGTVVILTARPSPAALRPGLQLGAPAGTLPDGTHVWDLHCGGGCSTNDAPWTNDLRWMNRGLIISISGEASVDHLRTLATDVVLK